MSSDERNQTRNGVWRRLTQGLSGSNVSRLWRSFRSAITCGKPSEVVSSYEIRSPIYTGPKNTVVWRGHKIQLSEDKFLSSEELRRQIRIIETKLDAKSRKLEGSKNEEKRSNVKIVRAAADGQVQAKIADGAGEAQK